jgi:hypothetical protein
MYENFIFAQRNIFRHKSMWECGQALRTDMLIDLTYPHNCCCCATIGYLPLCWNLRIVTHFDYLFSPDYLFVSWTCDKLLFYLKLPLKGMIESWTWPWELLCSQQRNNGSWSSVRNLVNMSHSDTEQLCVGWRFRHILIRIRVNRLSILNISNNSDVAVDAAEQCETFQIYIKF